MNAAALHSFVLGAGLLLSGCTTAPEHRVEPLRMHEVAAAVPAQDGSGLTAEAEEKVLALNPEQVAEQDVTDLLAHLPAPRIITIHGGLLPINWGMNSFAQFLVAMGYPEVSIRNPGSGAYTYGYYHRSRRIAGAVAWYYERDGLRPILIGHSQGAIHIIRVLHQLAGKSSKNVAVYNPVTQRDEPRYEVTDPLTGRALPVIGVQVCYATAALAGGLARLLPNQWDMINRLRQIPDSVEDFTGFQKGLDPLGGDFLGYGPANDYRALGTAVVRNVRLQAMCSHSTIPYAKSLLKHPAIRAWIQNHQPDGDGGSAAGPEPEFGWKNARILWAAEVWHAIKKHWVLELQRLIKAKRTEQHER